MCQSDSFRDLGVILQQQMKEKLGLQLETAHDDILSAEEETNRVTQPEGGIIFLNTSSVRRPCCCVRRISQEELRS